MNELHINHSGSHAWIAIVAVFLAIICAALFWLAPMTLNKQEIAECQGWKLDAEELHGFFLTQWQADQCAAHNISIDAPVK